MTKYESNKIKEKKWSEKPVKKYDLYRKAARVVK
jgi:hypothetical protein